MLAPAPAPARAREARAPVRASAVPRRTDRTSSRTRTARLRARADVLLLDPQSPEQRYLTGAAKDAQCPAKLIEEELEMSLAQPIGRAGLQEALARILTNRLEEAVAAFAAALTVHDRERLTDQPRPAASTWLETPTVA